MMYYYNDYVSPFHFFFGPVLMIVFWVLVIWAIMGLVKYFGKHSEDKKNHVIEILKERYAKGDITKEHFESMKKDIYE